MSDYSKSTNFTSKDTLPTGNAGKIVKGTELDTEFTAISSAIASKANASSPALLGTPTTPTATVGSNTTQIASTAFVKAAIDAQGLGNIATQAKSAVDITGGTIVGITDLTVTDGGTGSSSITSNSVILGNGTSALSGNLVAPGTSGNVLTSNGTTWTSTTGAYALTSGTAQNSTSGTSIDFTSIPSWVKRITVLFNGVSTAGSSNLLVQIGSGSVTTTGYVSTGAFNNSGGGAGTASSTSGFIVFGGDSTFTRSGTMVISSFGSNTWISTNTLKVSTDQTAHGGGNVSLGGILDRIRITTVNGTDAFDAGSINILYE